MVNEDEDVPNWTLDHTSVLSKKTARKFYSSGMKHMDWGNLIWLDEVPPAKTLVLWKLLYGSLPIDLEI